MFKFCFGIEYTLDVDLLACIDSLGLSSFLPFQKQHNYGCTKIYTNQASIKQDLADSCDVVP